MILLKLIGSTKTKKGLRIAARLDERDYETGIRYWMKICHNYKKLGCMNYIPFGIIP
jgi:hypothetical protein